LKEQENKEKKDLDAEFENDKEVGGSYRRWRGHADRRRMAWNL